MAIIDPSFRRLLQGQREQADCKWLERQCDRVCGSHGAQYNLSKLSAAAYLYNRATLNRLSEQETVVLLLEWLPHGFALELRTHSRFKPQFRASGTACIGSWLDIDELDKFALAIEACATGVARLKTYTVADVDALIAKFEDFV